MTEKPFAFSYSALSTYEGCSKKYYHLYDAKDVKDEDSSASVEGKEIHEAMKARVMKGTALPIEMRHFEKFAAKFAAIPGEKRAEMKLAITRKFEPCGWFAPDVYIRGIVDYLVVQGDTAIIVDWKTGKEKNDFTQMGLNAAILSRWMPEIQLFKTMLMFLNTGKVLPKNYSLSKLTDVWNDILPRAGKIEQARKTCSYTPSPGPLCKGWCPVKQCPHHQDR